MTAAQASAGKIFRRCDYGDSTRRQQLLPRRDQQLSSRRFKLGALLNCRNPKMYECACDVGWELEFADKTRWITADGWIFF